MSSRIHESESGHLSGSGDELAETASGLYAWRDRPLSRRAIEDIALAAKIFAIYRHSGGAYGASSIQAELADDHDIHVGKKRVARLMRAAGLQGLQPPRFVVTTIAGSDADQALDKVDRDFDADGPSEIACQKTPVSTCRSFGGAYGCAYLVPVPW